MPMTLISGAHRALPGHTPGGWAGGTPLGQNAAKWVGLVSTEADGSGPFPCWPRAQASRRSRRKLCCRALAEARSSIDAVYAPNWLVNARVTRFYSCPGFRIERTPGYSFFVRYFSYL